MDFKLDEKMSNYIDQFNFFEYVERDVLEIHTYATPSYRNVTKIMSTTCYSVIVFNEVTD